MDVSIKILRYDPESDRKGHWENYVVDAEPEAVSYTHLTLPTTLPV